MPGQPGNTNGARHGCYIVGILPKKLKNVERQVAKLRLALENAVMAQRSRVTVSEGAHINSACRWERLSQLAANWLRKRHDEMSDADRLAYARESARASSERDKCIKALKLDKAADDRFADLYRQPALTLDADVVDTTAVSSDDSEPDTCPVETANTDTE
jgi:hypothetical protein